MEKITTLLWILFGLGVFVYRMVKKMQETTARESRERPARPGGAVPSLPTATFQELLQQMQSRNSPESTQVPTPPTPRPEAPRTLGGRLMPRELARPARSQERTTVRQTSLEARATARPMNVPAPPARRSSAQPRAFTPVPQEYNRQASAANGPSVPLAATVRQLLSQPESVRAAFVLSEIFQRKY